MPSLLMITCFIGLGLFIHGCGEKSQITFTEDPTKPDLQDADATVAIARQWLSSEASEKTITIETGFGIVSQELSLKQAPNTEETLLQINRPINTGAIDSVFHDSGHRIDRLQPQQKMLLEVVR